MCLIGVLLGVGVLGGYTTFSTYTVDTLTLFQGGHVAAAVGYVLLTPVLALALGAAVTRILAASGGRGVSLS